MRIAIGAAALTVLVGVGLTAAIPNSALQGLPANTVLDLGPLECTPPAGDPTSCWHILNQSSFAYEPVSGRIVIFGGGHASSFTDTVMWFDPATTRWGRYYEPTPCANMTPANLDTGRAAWITGPSGPYPRPVSRHSYDLSLVIDGELIVLAQANGGAACPDASLWPRDPFFLPGRVAHFNLIARTWHFSPTATGDGDPEDGAGITYPSADYDPGLSRVILVGRWGLWTYDPRTKTKVRHLDRWKDADTGRSITGGEIGYDNSLVYAPVNDRHYYFSRASQGVYEVVLDRTNLENSRLRLVARGLPYQPGSSVARGTVYDAVARMIIFGPVDDVVYVFDPVAKTLIRQRVEGGSPGTLKDNAIAYDPVNGVIIFANLQGQTWAYRYGPGSLALPPPPSSLRFDP